MDRAKLIRTTQAVGESIATLRLDLNETGFVFLAGIARGAEEILMVVFNLLSDEKIQDKDL